MTGNVLMTEMPAFFRAETGTVDDAARWTQWVPQISKMCSSGSKSTLLRTVPVGAAGRSEIVVAPVGRHVAVFFTRQAPHLAGRILGTRCQLRADAWRIALLPAVVDPTWGADRAFPAHIWRQEHQSPVRR